MREHLLLEVREMLTFEHRGNHVISGTCGGGESVVKVPGVADCQQDDTDVSVTGAESEQSI